MKRVWQEASPVHGPDGWHIALDGKPLRVPGTGVFLQLPSQALAQAVAAEWMAAAPDHGITPDELPLTRLAATAQIRIAPDPAASVAALAHYGETDLLCYRAAPGELADRQHQAWQPWLDWLRREHGAALVATAGIMPVPQHPAALQAIHAALARHGVPTLAGLGVIVPLLGSVALGLALAEGALPPDRAHAIACLEEIHQAALWGEDTEASARRTRIGTEIAEAARFIQLSRD